MKNVQDIRDEFAVKLKNKEFVVLPSGTKTIEISPAFFVASEPLILGEVNDDYVRRELEWYESQSLNVNDIPGGPPPIWKKCATPEGAINSNYGWCIYSQENGLQYQNVREELKNDPSSRRGVMIYTRPSMHLDQNAGGKQDFMCTNAVQYVWRYGALYAYVNMRSNDAYHGYRNDYAWQRRVLENLARDLDTEVGEMYWFAGSLHFYEPHFYLVDHFDRTEEISITKKEYDERYAT